jgi:hypothetical protein
MARTIILNKYDDQTTDVTFTVTGATNTKLNRQYVVNGAPSTSLKDLMQFIRDYINGYRDGLAAVKRDKAPAEITSAIDVEQIDTEA